MKSKKLKALCAVLLGMACMLVFAPVNVRAALTEEEMAEAELVKYGGTYDDNTYYKLNVEEDGYLTFEASGMFGPVAQFYSEDGEYLFSRYIETTVEKNNTGIWIVGIEKGEYFLYMDNDEPSYPNVARILFTKDSYAEKEPNNSTKQAQEIILNQSYKASIGKNYSGSGYISSISDTDYYKFLIEDGKVYQIRLIYETGSLLGKTSYPDILDEDTDYSRIYNKKTTSLESDEVINDYIFIADGSGYVWAAINCMQLEAGFRDYTIEVSLYNGFLEESNGTRYWYEDGVRQGYNPKNKAYRGKEIYDPESDAWYWLDNIQDGAVAVSKDVYQESDAGPYADREDGTGKWVRYDANGHMVKGWSEKNGDTYYFDEIYGAMVKGWQEIEGERYFFDMESGILIEGGLEIGCDNGWWSNDGKKYWYENGERQGFEPTNPEYRGKEIYDPASDEWYWLDNVEYGAMAVSKDVYQESDAGPYADREDGTGKWVRYDENGHMVKGWDTQNGNRYYFDETYGAMVKGLQTINGVTYYFNEQTGVLERTL